MKQNTFNNLNEILYKTPVTGKVREKLVEAISDILDWKFYHRYAPISKNALVRVHVPELIDLHNFLTGTIIGSKDLLTRPPCPIQWQNHHSAARYDYKLAIVQYISTFGFQLTSQNPCNYNPAFLEALANYCEHAVKNEKIEKDNDSKKVSLLAPLD